MLYAALLGFGLFFAGWGIVFVVSLAYAPTQLDAECQTTISKLAYKLALPDQALAEHIRGLLAQISENGKKVLRLTLLYEVIETRQIKIEGMSFDETRDATNECISVGLLRIELENVDMSSPLAVAYQRGFCQIPPGFRETLKRLLYTIPEQQSPVTAS
jgi:hypothetical protein